MEIGSRDERIHGDVLLVVVFEASVHFNARERTKLAVRPIFVLSGRPLKCRTQRAEWDTADCQAEN
jgi:hypothetical protein